MRPIKSLATYLSGAYEYWVEHIHKDDTFNLCEDEDKKFLLNACRARLGEMTGIVNGEDEQGDAQAAARIDDLVAATATITLSDR